jgi:cytidylate kinase
MITPILNLERQADTLARAQRHWQEQVHTARRAKPTYSVTISREAGADGATIAAEVANRLGWPVYDRELIERIAREMGLRTNLVQAVDEHRKSWLLECVEAFTSAVTLSESKFVRYLVETLLSLSTLGHCVIVGRGASQVLPAASTLRVRLVGAKEDRIGTIQRRMHLLPDQAAKWVDDTDRERAAFVKDHFFKDPADSSLYDLVLNTSRWTAGDCADLIIDALKKLEMRTP